MLKDLVGLSLPPKPSLGFVNLCSDDCEFTFGFAGNSPKGFAGLLEKEIKEKINLLLQQREVFYLLAHHKINTSHKSDDAILDEITTSLR